MALCLNGSRALLIPYAHENALTASHLEETFWYRAASLEGTSVIGIFTSLPGAGFRRLWRRVRV